VENEAIQAENCIKIESEPFLHADSQAYADQLIFKDTKGPSQVSEKIEADGPKNGHRAGPPRLYLVE
jgi:hypothetical protein